MFVGKPSTLFDVNNPDWVPNQKLGYKKISVRRTCLEETDIKKLNKKLKGIEVKFFHRIQQFCLWFVEMPTK